MRFRDRMVSPFGSIYHKKERKKEEEEYDSSTMDYILGPEEIYSGSKIEFLGI